MITEHTNFILPCLRSLVCTSPWLFGHFLTFKLDFYNPHSDKFQHSTLSHPFESEMDSQEKVEEVFAQDWLQMNESEW